MAGLGLNKGQLGAKIVELNGIIANLKSQKSTLDNEISQAERKREAYQVVKNFCQNMIDDHDMIWIALEEKEKSITAIKQEAEASYSIIFESNSVENSQTPEKREELENVINSINEILAGIQSAIEKCNAKLKDYSYNKEMAVNEISNLSLALSRMANERLRVIDNISVNQTEIDEYRRACRRAYGRRY